MMKLGCYSMLSRCTPPVALLSFACLGDMHVGNVNALLNIRCAHLKGANSSVH